VSLQQLREPLQHAGAYPGGFQGQTPVTQKQDYDLKTPWIPPASVSWSKA